MCYASHSDETVAKCNVSTQHASRRCSGRFARWIMLWLVITSDSRRACQTHSTRPCSTLLGYSRYSPGQTHSCCCCCHYMLTTTNIQWGPHTLATNSNLHTSQLSYGNCQRQKTVCKTRAGLAMSHCCDAPLMAPSAKTAGQPGKAATVRPLLA
jgi:hypothetical protein